MSEKSSIGVGVIGSGFARTTQAPGFRACEGARIVAIASGRRENAESAAREFEIPFVADDWREIVAREDVDLVSIVTPPSTHAEIALAALDAGKAVLCEKPTAMNFEEAARMRERAEETGLFAYIDHELRFLPSRRRMREMIQGGEIGKVRHARMIFSSDSRASNERAWDWWSDAESGGGVLGAIGSHAIDSLHWLMGAQTRDVFCALATHVAERPDEKTQSLRRVTTDDEANLILSFEDADATEGATASVSLSVVEIGRNEHFIEVFGSRGGLRVEGERLFHSKSSADDWREIEVERAPLAEGMRENEWSRAFTVFAREIIEALKREGRKARVALAADFDQGYRTQRVLDAARNSHESGCRATVAY